MTELEITQAILACAYQGCRDLPLNDFNRVIAFCRSLVDSATAHAAVNALEAAEEEPENVNLTDVITTERKVEALAEGQAELRTEQKDVLERLAVLEGRADALVAKEEERRDRLGCTEAAAKEGEAEAEPTPVPEQKNVLERLAVVEELVESFSELNTNASVNYSHLTQEVAVLKGTVKGLFAAFDDHNHKIIGTIRWTTCRPEQDET